ncbi:MAG TPA: hypothetical protein VHC90_09335 [Bryobacteraceae bacterium]|nr:hypothetical protein [Bryobacteraceae bacterium]
MAQAAGGSRQLAAMNQDGTIKPSTNATAGGSTVTLYGTGAGTTSPAAVDGSIQRVGIVPIQKLSLTIGGQPAAIVARWDARRFSRRRNRHSRHASRWIDGGSRARCADRWVRGGYAKRDDHREEGQSSAFLSQRIFRERNSRGLCLKV